VRLVLRQGLWPLAAGLVTGVIVFVLSARLLTAFMCALPAVRTAALTAVATAVTLLALVAMVVPARRALSVDPTVTLRSE
jgi:putative ABC transport system permease protein